MSATAPTTQTPPHVMVHGTFDVANFGDLLFPHLLAFGLHPLAHRLTAVSPRGGRLAWADTLEALPSAQARAVAADLHVIGGGNIIHAIGTPLAEYAAIPDAYAELWLGPAAQAARAGAKLAWNAPGVPRSLAGLPGLEAALACADLLSVRDAASAAHLGPTARPTIVPDTALDLARMWPAATLADHATRAFARHGLPRPARWIALHANDRYLDGDAAAMAAHLTALARAHDAVPVLLALGPCQGDDALARAIGAHLPPGSLVLDQPAGLREIAGLIAHAEAYAGSSLHGLISALSYGRPALVVARGPLEKFAGFLAHLGMEPRHRPGWPDAVAAAPTLLAPLDPPAIAAIARAQDRIALHWHRLRTLLAGPPDAAAAIARRRLAGQPAPPPPAPPPPKPESKPEPKPAPPPVAPRPGIACNICGGAEFRDIATLPDLIGAGWLCAGFGASARHRALRCVVETLRTQAWRERTCLRLGATGRITAAGWFRAAADAPEPGASYDLVVAVDALEAAPDLAATLATWRALLRPGGILLLSLRTVPGRAETLDWAFPRGDRDGERRAFGTDIAALLPALLPGAALRQIRTEDPVTGLPAIAFAVAEDPALLAPLPA